VLFVEHTRGIDASGDRYEHKRYIGLPADYPIRELKSRPGYR
jgi:hypothetical protein